MQLPFEIVLPLFRVIGRALISRTVIQKLSYERRVRDYTSCRVDRSP